MRVASVHVENFRSLEDATIELSDVATLIVGRNNSGKTSLTEIFFKFLGGEKTSLTFEDISVSRLSDLKRAYTLYCDAIQDGAASKDGIIEACDLVPSIRLSLAIEYDDDENIASLAPFIMDLDPDRRDVTLLCRMAVRRPEQLFEEFRSTQAATDGDIVGFIKKNFNRFYDVSYWALDRFDTHHLQEVTRTAVLEALSVRFIYAQNRLDDLSIDRTRGLSRGFEAYFKAISAQDAVTQSLDTALGEVAASLDSQYSQLFEAVFDDLKSFGVSRIETVQDVRVVSRFRVDELLRGTTHLVYPHGEDGHLLPEHHNGLGYTKLIFTLLQMISFAEEFSASVPQPGLQLIFLEEPEAHLHPQMQTAFMRNIEEFIRGKAGWNVQLAVTTHSSHIIAESGFSCIRYFDNSVQPLAVKNLSEFEAKLGASQPDSLKFLKQYMVLHRCDMFFADKVVLIEGTVERLLLPILIEREAKSLLHKYISVVEVGGAYAHMFEQLLKFLNVQTLIVTDIDSVSPEGRHPACKVETPGAISSNMTLKSWLPNRASIEDLLDCEADAKTSGRIRVTYQVREPAAQRVGRSFEEAFILANTDLASWWEPTSSPKLFHDRGSGRKLTSSEAGEQAYELADKIESKTDFAFDILMLARWNTPTYLKEGLLWLAATPST